MRYDLIIPNKKLPKHCRNSFPGGVPQINCSLTNARWNDQFSYEKVLRMMHPSKGSPSKLLSEIGFLCYFDMWSYAMEVFLIKQQDAALLKIHSILDTRLVIKGVFKNRYVVDT